MDVTSLTSQTTAQTAAQTAAPPQGTSQGGASPGGTLINNDFQTFLLMLTTQMKNQDPLNPVDSSDYASQLATFSGVEQQVKTNTLLESLAAQTGLSGMAQMAAWVGMEARVTAPVMFDGAPITLYPAPAPGTEQAVLVVLDAAGQEVARHEIPVSQEPVTWAGTDASGTPFPSGPYSFRVENYTAGELSQTTGVEAYGRIEEVRNGTTGVTLVLEGGGTVTPAEIHAVRSPASG